MLETAPSELSAVVCELHCAKERRPKWRSRVRQTQRGAAETKRLACYICTLPTRRRPGVQFREISARAPKGHNTAACAYRIVTVTHVVWHVFRISWYVYGYAHLRATDED